MKILAIIPARMGSSRFPGKPMADLNGSPMIRHIYERTISCSLLDLTVVATCDVEIAEYVRSIGGRAVMTSDKHVRATDRCAEAVTIVEDEDEVCFDIVVMVQGDEPMIRPEMITTGVQPLLEDPLIPVTTLLGRISSMDDLRDPNFIKITCDKYGNALYFSRAPIAGTVDYPAVGRHVAIIPFRRDFLLEFASMVSTPLEASEAIDMLRVLEHGYQVRMVPTDLPSHAVDTLEDLEKVSTMMTALKKAD
ncbi:MAG: 3-deoxy-manno-octulosonate cytidylyltransferase [Acidobacteria bacterium]|jgi:3-deoxy-manno-octulosonate cytidylyltransferase (CMP-KDO synthetase)|nr:3-deoxy-manno-octulosonate cytidylyltransferase [Acidobacteriota bacterium]|tara:strand:+ start:6385 stop:7134 length:750 start_codon:yes stop_codon:yes gene_type:complete